MQAQATSPEIADGIDTPAWGGVYAISLGAFALVASEFMPVSLLTPIARDLAISEGQAGQAIAASGAFAVLTSLLLTKIAGRLDRKILLLALTGIMIVSGTLAAAAPTYFAFMLGRALIGIAIGGFWSLSAAIAMRLVPADSVPRALAVVNGGNALATVIAAPLGSFLGSIVGWRGASFALVPVAVAVLVWQTLSLPSLKAEHRAGIGNPLRLLGRPAVALGMAAVSIFFMGQFALFTYVRPFLETVTRVPALSLSLILLLVGGMGFIGTLLIGSFIRKSLYVTLAAIPLVMTAIALGLIAFGGRFDVTTALLGLWGLVATSAPVGWWTWLSRTLPHDAEAGGGLMVAVVQIAITSGAGLGGVLYDTSGYMATFAASSAICLVAAGLSALTGRLDGRRGF